jgi:adenosylcobinamide-phosphate synthase
MPATDWLHLAWTPPWRTLAALGFEALVGYPATLHRVIPHPVTWLGFIIDRLDHYGNQPRFSDALRRGLGITTLIVIAGIAALAGLLLQAALPSNAVGLLAFAIVASPGLAQRSLFDHVARVARALDAGDLDGARRAVAHIVGRDTATMQPPQVAVAALESLSENFNDGVVAPAFWLLVGGLPGLFAYKAVNTADSMIGHLEPRWRAFGWAAARTDDLMNILPARLAGLLIVAVGRRGWATMLRDAPAHASPNAGWPEAAMAGALACQLGGPVTYDGEVSERPRFGTGPMPNAADLRRGLRLYLAACGLLWAMLIAGGLAWPR